MSKIVTTVLVDDNNLFREGLRRILSATAFRVAKVTAAIDDIPLQAFRGSRPALFLIGTDGDHAATTIAVGRLRAQNPTARIVVLSDRCHSDDALVVLRAGADGYLLKQISCDALIKALDLVMLGVTILPAAVNRRLGEANETECDDSPKPVGPMKMIKLEAAPTNMIKLEHVPRRLSDRETEILRCLTRGDSNKTIARQFDITEPTVKTHIKAILRKIYVRNRTQAAVWANNHLLDPATTALRPIANGNGQIHN